MFNFTQLAKFSLIVLFFSILTACSRDSIKGEGEAKQEERKVNTFTGLEVDGNYTILGTIGTPQELIISSNSNILPYIKSSIDDDNLIIKSDEKVKLQPTVKQNIWFTTEKFNTLRLSGNTQFQISSLNNENLDCTFKGSHKVMLQGKSTNLKIIINGSANINAKSLEIKNADIEINGSGTVALNVSDNLKVKINGDGNVVYYNGQPKIEQTISGSGRVISAFGVLEKNH